MQERYHRQLILKGFGTAAQQRLADARVLVIGAGGLGCPIMQYLVAAGVGHIGIADHDRVSLSNLHRQVLFGDEDIGSLKVEVAKRRLMALNPEININIWPVSWTQSHCLDHFPTYDVVVDATDNFATRYLINDACVLLQKPLVFGAVSQYEGQVAVFNHLRSDGSRSVNYRDLFPVPPQSGEVLNCAEGGVLGVLPGIIGSMQAMEVIKLITGIGEPLADRLLTYDALFQQFLDFTLSPHPDSAAMTPPSPKEYLALDYARACSMDITDQKETDPGDWRQNHLANPLVDIREAHEQPRLAELCASLGVTLVEIPMSGLHEHAGEFSGKSVTIICQSGKRSLAAIRILEQMDETIMARSLKGGVNALFTFK
ncbi:MAG: HesA/MoeB/ThiF family protein [Chitinophagaceae bacterium]|jgi:adenylyltransferase/sulfurtransferase|nr:HesA/MoeB/ThiF family protein [Chitinophagaceae bacterium]